MPSKLIALVFVSVCMLTACVPPDLMSTTTPGNDSTPDQQEDTSGGGGQFPEVTQILATNCAVDSCHNGSSSFEPKIEGGTSATPAQVKAALEGIEGPLSQLALVTPGDIDNSLIWVRMSSDVQPMPAAGKLPQEQLDVIKAWIEAGAPYDVDVEPPVEDMGPDLSDSTPDSTEEDETVDEADAGPTKFSEIAPLLAAECGGCHNATYDHLPNFASSGNSDVAEVRTALEGIESGQIPGTLLIDVIYDRLRGMNGQVMPLGSMLDQSDIDKYASWLNAGASYDE